MTEFFFLDNPSFSPPRDYLTEIIGLYMEQGWWDGPEDPDMALRIVNGSHCFLVAVERDRIVGMGRAISDKASDAYIQDVAVKRACRGRKIGRGIVGAIVDRLHKDGLFWIGLIAEKGSLKFYEPIGFKTMPDATPMIYSEK
jgi:aralkylamine N-acetyltransferase